MIVLIRAYAACRDTLSSWCRAIISIFRHIFRFAIPLYFDTPPY
jgi:hypothetical protein